MAFDGFVTKSIISELRKFLLNGKINKVFEPNKNEILLGIYSNGKNYLLNLSAHADFCRIHITNHQKPNPQNALNFCMLLRKYLIGSKIIDISNMDLERTIEIKFECYNEMNDLVIRKLYIQIMSRQSNIILTNENDIIIDSLKHFDNCLPAHEFEFPPILKQSFIKLENFDEFLSFINSNKNANLIKKLTTSFIGFSNSIVAKSLEILQINENSYTTDDLQKIFNYFKNLIINIENNSYNNYSICKINNDYTLSLSTDNNSEQLKINRYLDEFYYEKEENQLFSNFRNNLLKMILDNLKKVYKKLENINKKLKDCENLDIYRLYGELLTANLYKLTKESNLTQITVENYYDNNKPITIPLDSSISVQKNIDKYFKKYNKLKNALEIVSLQKQDAEKELDYIESIVFSLENAKSILDINEIYEEIEENFSLKKKNFKKQSIKKNTKLSINKEQNFETHNIDGYTVYVGKNNIQNDYLTLKFSSKNDIWFHTQTVHGSHVILKRNDLEEPKYDTLYKCATLAAKNSKAINSSNILVDYCLVKYVKKPNNAKPGKVIYTNYKTINVKTVQSI